VEQGEQQYLDGEKDRACPRDEEMDFGSGLWAWVAQEQLPYWEGERDRGAYQRDEETDFGLRVGVVRGELQYLDEGKDRACLRDEGMGFGLRVGVVRGEQEYLDEGKDRACLRDEEMGFESGLWVWVVPEQLKHRGGERDRAYQRDG